MGETSVGVVVIGRNEGERLRACLRSIPPANARVYVDSGSIDGSCALARSLGFDVVELASPPGFTAARARNEGVERLLAARPDLAFVQTIDGDCVLHEGWLDRALSDMAGDARRAAVFGRRRERFPAANLYHAATDHEWNVPLGEVAACGGDALLRIAALREVDGYDGALIAGEEPEMCLRLRQRGWRIWSNGAEMTLHDIAMTRFAQWWRRSQRTGFAFAQLVRMYGSTADAHWRRLMRSALAWSAIAVAPVGLLVAALAMRQPALAVVALAFAALLGVQVVRLARQQRAVGSGWRNALLWGWLIIAGKLAQSQGWVQFQLQQLLKRRTGLIEYR
ncbi:glycosyltransferase family 2 protein [uncultured Sphingomonas sp.]|uniref:glycosyltransferase family 2 protein n=1 Tax=uncultured Sphingomonas sp. TaxID=158754 RepID=UPI0035CB8412